MPPTAFDKMRANRRRAALPGLLLERERLQERIEEIERDFEEQWCEADLRVPESLPPRLPRRFSLFTRMAGW